jgi:hypothetical protein
LKAERVWRRLLRASGLGVALLLLATPAAMSAVGTPFTGSDFTDPIGSAFVVSAPAAAASAHPDVIVKVTVTGGQLTDGGGSEGAIWWRPAAPIPAGSLPSFALGCDGTGNAPCTGHVDWYDVTDMPTDLTGVITSGTDGESTLEFPTPLGGGYGVGGGVSGNVLIDPHACNSSTAGGLLISPPGDDVSLGVYPPGQGAICVRAPDGGAVSWELSVGKNQADFDSMTLSSTLIRPQEQAAFTYVLTEPTYLTSWITDSRFTPVRTLSTAVPSAAGAGTQPFDGLDASGHPLPDGEYWVNSTVVGEGGSVLEAKPFIIDGTGPTIAVPTREVTTASGAVTVNVADANGVASVAVTARGSTTTYPSDESGTISFVPGQAWISGIGRNTLTITATDAAGNTSTLTQSLSYIGPAPKQPASARGRIDKAWVSRSAGGHAAHVLAHGTRTLYASFHFARLPASGTITTVWYEPNGKATRAVPKRRTSTVRAFVKSTGALPRGLWRCVLRVNGVDLRDTSVRVG